MRFVLCVLLLGVLCSSVLAVDAASLKSLPTVDLLANSTMITIPAGPFVMGSNLGDLEEQPVHKVYLDAYQIGKCEVTVGQYRAFCEATARQMPKEPAWGWREDYPIVNVTWDDAQAYCEWAGGRLPTEAEWEKAARGTDGRMYPWGNLWDRSCCVNGELGIKSAMPVGSCPASASPYGCLDMAGNVWEWCSDWYGADYYKASPSKNPTGPASGDFHVMRGGCFYSYEGGTRCTYRGNFFPSGSWYSGGFRLAR